LLCAVASSAASATVVTFDDLPSGMVNNGYHTPSTSNGGYWTGLVSGKNAAYNSSFEPAYFSSAASFSLQSIEVTKAWANGFTHFEGYVGNTLTYQMNVFSTTSGPTHARFDWSNLNKVIMSDGNQTYQSVIDNLTINAAAVPEPATGATMLAGLAMIAFMVRRVREPKPGNQAR
jgi:hypothetical protein